MASRVTGLREEPVERGGTLATGGCRPRNCPGWTSADRMSACRNGRAGRTVTVGEVSAPRRGQRFAFVMDTRLRDGVFALADGADLLVIESTFLDEDAALAADYGHLTAAQAARVAAECGVRRPVLTHFSGRYTDPRRCHDEAAAIFSGDVVVAEDLMRVPVPARR